MLDLADRTHPVVRGPIDVPGIARAGAWSGDTLLVAASYGLERFRVSPSPVAVPALSLSYEDASALPRVVIRWPAGLLIGPTGANLFRDRLDAGAGPIEAAGIQLNGPPLPPTSTGAVDGQIVAGATYRYRLEGLGLDGSSLELSEGVISIPSGARLGRPYPNPFRAAAAGPLTIPFRTAAAAAGSAVEIRVFDVRGRLVRGLAVPAAAAGGFGAAVWNGKNDQGVPAASGLYLIHVRGPGIDDSKSVILVR